MRPGVKTLKKRPHLAARASQWRQHSHMAMTHTAVVAQLKEGLRIGAVLSVGPNEQ